MAITFLSYSLSDKVMVWLLVNCVFFGAYAYTTQKETIVKQVAKLWGLFQEHTMGFLEKIPKHKTE